MIYTYRIEEVALQTGDIICTMNGKPDILPGEFWRFIGRLVPGDVDHLAIYLGPDGRCVEAGARGVITFDVPHGHWDTEQWRSSAGCFWIPFMGFPRPSTECRPLKTRKTKCAPRWHSIVSSR